MSSGEPTNGLENQSEGKPDVQNQSSLTGGWKLNISPVPGLHTDQARQSYPRSKDCKSILKSPLSENISCYNLGNIEIILYDSLFEEPKPREVNVTTQVQELVNRRAKTKPLELNTYIWDGQMDNPHETHSKSNTCCLHYLVIWMLHTFPQRIQ